MLEAIEGADMPSHKQCEQRVTSQLQSLTAFYLYEPSITCCQCVQLYAGMNKSCKRCLGCTM